MNYDGNLHDAFLVFIISILASIVSFIGVPYNGLLIAKENFLLFSIVEIISHIIRLIVAYVLVSHFENKLVIYSLTIGLMTALPTLISIIYCKRYYYEICRLKFVREVKRYKEVLSFSSWVGIGAIAMVGKNQGASILVNLFFNTTMNAAMGIASTINAYVSMFAQNLTQPMAPQLTKSYASGNVARTEELLIMSTKFSYLMTLTLGSFFLISPNWLLSVWLGENVPQYTEIFLILFIIDNLVQSLNQGVGTLIFASGKLPLYQILVSICNLMSVIIGYFILNSGADAYYLIVVYIIISSLKFFGVQWALHRTLACNFGLFRKSYFPSIIVTFMFLPAVIVPMNIHPIIKLSISIVYLLVLIYAIGLSKNERYYLKSPISNMLHKDK